MEATHLYVYRSKYLLLLIDLINNLPSNQIYICLVCKQAITATISITITCKFA